MQEVNTLITADELAAFSGVTKDTDTVTTSLLNIYIGAATDKIAAYLGYDPLTDTEHYDTIPPTMKLVCLEIATLIQLEEQNNIGVNSKSFGDSGSRSFLNVTNFDPYLSKLSRWRAV